MSLQEYEQFLQDPEQTFSECDYWGERPELVKAYNKQIREKKEADKKKRENEWKQKVEYEKKLSNLLKATCEIDDKTYRWNSSIRGYFANQDEHQRLFDIFGKWKQEHAELIALWYIEYEKSEVPFIAFREAKNKESVETATAAAATD